MTINADDSLSEPIGLFYTWWRGDRLPDLPLLPGLVLQPTTDQPLIAEETDLPPDEIASRIRQGHQPWLAWVNGEPVGYGWAATKTADIGELGITLHLPRGSRYLWSFVTRPPWRRRGIYSRLIQAMINSDHNADRFWIGHDVGNDASARGIIRAGFRSTGTLYRQQTGAFVLITEGPVDRAAAAAALLDVPVVDLENDE